MLLADRGFDADWIRMFATERGTWTNIPRRSNRNNPICFSPCISIARESGRAVLQQDQALSSGATRYHKLPANPLAFVQLASIRLWLRAHESTS
jgi:transposase